MARQDLFGRTASRATPVTPASPPAEGRITWVGGGKCKFVVDRFDAQLEWGPVPHAATGIPAVGDRCAVMFLGVGTANPIVICWWPDGL